MPALLAWSTPTLARDAGSGVAGVMAFLQRTVAAVRQGVVARLNLNATPSLTSLRGFAAASYLDKDEVVKRVTDVIKNFDRVDGSKVRAGGMTQLRNAYDTCEDVAMSSGHIFSWMAIDAYVRSRDASMQGAARRGSTLAPTGPQPPHAWVWFHALLPPILTHCLLHDLYR